MTADECHGNSATSKRRRSIRSEQYMTDATVDQQAYAAAERLLGAPLVLPLGPGEPEVGNDFKRLATRHAFGDSWTRPGLDTRSRALISVTIAAVLARMNHYAVN